MKLCFHIQFNLSNMTLKCGNAMSNMTIPTAGSSQKFLEILLTESKSIKYTHRFRPYPDALVCKNLTFSFSLSICNWIFTTRNTIK